MGGLLGRHGRSMPREMDFEEPGRQEEPFRTQLRLNRHPMYVCMLGSDLEAPEEVQGLIGLTPDDVGLCQSLDTAMAFVFVWLEGEGGPEEGKLFLASPAVKNYHSNRNLFLLDDHKVLWKKSGKEGEKRLLVVPRELKQEVPVSSSRKSSGCVMAFPQLDTRG